MANSLNLTKLNFPFSKELTTLFKILNHNSNLRIVGGAVRDFILKNPTKDIDLACSYTPEKTIDILNSYNIKTLKTGIKYGTITAIVNDKLFEITTLRSDINSQGRKSDVKFIDDFLSDAKRRDFTINAMSINEDGELFDYFGGFNDANNGIIRFIGNPEQRIKEDYLRILRFFRFSCYYSKNFHLDSLSAAIKLKSNIQKLSADRIRGELLNIINCHNNKRLIKVLELMNSNQILAEILLFNKINLKFLENFFVFSNISGEMGNIILKFAILTYSSSSFIYEIAKKLNFSNKNIKYLNLIIKLSKSINVNMSKNNIIELIFDYDKNLLIDALILNITTRDISNYSDIALKYLDIKDFVINFKSPKFIVDGNDLLQNHINPKDISKTLKILRKIWIDSDFSLKKSEILKKIHQKSFS